MKAYNFFTWPITGCEIKSKYFSERELPRSMEPRTKRISMAGDDYAMF